MYWEIEPHHLNTSNIRTLARCITLIENETAGYETFLAKIPTTENSTIIGLTGPPGAGKSTITDALIESYVLQGEKVAVLCIDPSSPFNMGAILGDRIRMNSWYNHPNVFIRSLASRGSLGGLSPMVADISELLKAAGYTRVLIETVGVGQSEVDVAGLADTTIVVLVPESGDDIQSMKSGVLEIADVLVVNKCDRPEAESLITKLKQQLSYSEKKQETPVIKCIASTKEGIKEIIGSIEEVKTQSRNNYRKLILQAQRLHQIIQRKKMKPFHKAHLLSAIQTEGENLNLYALAEKLCS
jgi:LAO/AO transport system kinase